MPIFILKGIVYLKAGISAVKTGIDFLRKLFGPNGDEGGGQTPSSPSGDPSRSEEIRLDSEKKEIANEIAYLKGKLRQKQNEFEDNEEREKKLDRQDGAHSISEKVNEYIVLVVLIVGFLYVYGFYAAAIYGATLREFGVSDILGLTTLLDPNVFSNLSKKGIFGYIVPFGLPILIVGGLPILLHIFLDKAGYKWKLAAGGVFVFTFLVDLLISFQVAKKAFEAQANALVNDTYNLIRAFTDAGFLMVLMMGFFGVVILSILYHFYIGMLDNKARIRRLKERNEEIERNMRDIKEKMNELEFKLAEKKDELARISLH